MAVGEIKVGDLPTMSAQEFTANDFVFIIDDGVYAKKIGRSDFLEVVKTLAKGDKGDVGATGATGNTGQQGQQGIQGAKGDTGEQGIQGEQGVQGIAGFDGWSPLLSVITDGDRRVLQLTSWAGGTGEEPTSGQYIGSTGLVSDISLAIDIRGATGIQGEQGNKGEDGVNATTISSLSYNNDNSLTVTYADTTTATSNTPKNLLGWASYKDSQYTSSAKFSIGVSTTVVIPNDAVTKIETSLPQGFSSLYNSITQKIGLTNANSLYGIRIRFKLTNSGGATDFINITLDKSTTDTPYSEDKLIRADAAPQVMEISTFIYGDSTIATNGLTVRLKSGTQTVQIYDVEFIISKLT